MLTRSKCAPRLTASRTAIIAILLNLLPFGSVCLAQQDLLPAFPNELKGDGQNGNVAYFIGDNRPFTGILVEEKSNTRLGEFKNGLRHGVFREFYPTGAKKSECSFTEGRRNGKCSEWYPNNQEKSSFVFANGRVVDGKYVTYLENGSREAETTYQNEEIVSLAKYENGKLIELSELSVEWYDTGKKRSTGLLTNGKKHGLWTSWYEDGVKKSEETYRDGILDGATTNWFPSGEKQSEGVWRDGSQDGHWTNWLVDGRKEFDGALKNGKKDGIGTTYNYKENLTYTGGFKNDLKDGYGTITFFDGRINFQGDFKNGLPEGRGTAYDNGRIFYDGEWKGGKKHGRGELNTVHEGIIVHYRGDFLNDRWTGQGTMTMRTAEGRNSSFAGELRNGEPFNGLMHGTHPDGMKTITEIKDGVWGKTIRPGAANSTVISYASPSINSARIASVAVLPLRPGTMSAPELSLSDADNTAITEMFQTEFAKKNPAIALRNSSSTKEVLRSGSLATNYEQFASDYDKTSFPDPAMLASIGRELGADAFVEGVVLQVEQVDGKFINPSRQGSTKLTIKFIMFSASTGSVLWEATCQVVDTVSSLKRAPAISEMVEAIRAKVAPALPTLPPPR